MDSNQYISGGIGASIVLALIIAKQVYNTINHKRIRSKCCGQNLEASVDIDETTPKETSAETSTVVVEHKVHELIGNDQSIKRGER
jgi:hypothetical protein